MSAPGAAVPTTNFVGCLAATFAGHEPRPRSNITSSLCAALLAHPRGRATQPLSHARGHLLFGGKMYDLPSVPSSSCSLQPPVWRSREPRGRFVRRNFNALLRLHRRCGLRHDALNLKLGHSPCARPSPCTCSSTSGWCIRRRDDEVIAVEALHVDLSDCWSSCPCVRRRLSPGNQPSGDPSCHNCSKCVFPCRWPGAH